jgi:hypothetical protein
MININKIKIYILSDSDIKHTQSLNIDLYIDYMVELPDKLSMCLMLDNNRLSEELSDFEFYYLDDLDLIDSDYYLALNQILDYIGLNEDIDGILDLMFQNKHDQNRLFYLKSVLHYKTTQEGKELKSYILKVKHFDDLAHQFPEDFIFFDIISNNDDYSESEIYLMSYLTENEIKNKFINYII